MAAASHDILDPLGLMLRFPWRRDYFSAVTRQFLQCFWGHFTCNLHILSFQIHVFNTIKISRLQYSPRFTFRFGCTYDFLYRRFAASTGSLSGAVYIVLRRFLQFGLLREEVDFQFPVWMVFMMCSGG